MIQKQKTRNVCHLETEEGENRETDRKINLSGIVERKRTMKPPEYRKLQREGLEKMIEMEKEKSDQQSQCCDGRWRETTTPENLEPRREGSTENF
jgi:hypothetical protein